MLNHSCAALPCHIRSPIIAAIIDHDHFAEQWEARSDIKHFTNARSLVERWNNRADSRRLPALLLLRLHYTPSASAIQAGGW